MAPLIGTIPRGTGIFAMDEQHPSAPPRVVSAVAQSQGQPSGRAIPRLSVVIPAQNEAQLIGPVLKHVYQGSPWEVIVVDGHSIDRTAYIAKAADATVITSEPSRARQMNAGAAAASGDVLLFLHADTLLPPHFDRHVFDVLGRPGVVAGAFALRINGSPRSLRLIEKTVEWRSRVRQMPYGDQAIFLTTGMFDRVGGYPDLPTMEDFELVRRLRRLGRIEIAPAPVLTSARRWLECGVWRTTLVNKACIAAYLLGVRPARIARWRLMGKQQHIEPFALSSDLSRRTLPR